MKQKIIETVKKLYSKEVDNNCRTDNLNFYKSNSLIS